jgi:hypothetical protein
MSTLGKVLLFFNLLVAAGVAYFASTAWANRQQHNVAQVKHALVTDGFPLEATGTVDWNNESAKVPFALRTGSGRESDEVPVKVLKEVFAGAKGEYTAATPPASIAGDVKEVQKQFESAVSGKMGDPRAALQFLIGGIAQDGRLVPGPLTLLADDFEERATFRRWLSEATANPNQAGKFADLAAKTVTRKFNEVVQPSNPATAAAHQQAVLDARKARDAAFDEFQKADVVQKQAKFNDLNAAQDKLDAALADPNTASATDAERRRRAGGLLAFLDPSAPAQKRAALVLGLKGYAAALYDRVARLKVMPERYERAIEAELSQFVVRYEQQLTAAKDIDRLLTQQRSNRLALDESDAHLAKMNEARRTQRDTAKAQADKFQVDTDAQSTKLAGFEQEVFRLQKQVGALLNANFDLEEQLIQAERRKAAGK